MAVVALSFAEDPAVSADQDVAESRNKGGNRGGYGGGHGGYRGGHSSYGGGRVGGHRKGRSIEDGVDSPVEIDQDMDVQESRYGGYGGGRGGYGGGRGHGGGHRRGRSIEDAAEAGYPVQVEDAADDMDVAEHRYGGYGGGRRGGYSGGYGGGHRGGYGGYGGGYYGGHRG